ncbi:MAG: IS110 family transposase [Winogradskyella sp.]|uniref:IS110 family transposase n=1 Tax=Winogradskyella sp. TaxID=1883156 RepID=UPI0017AAC7F5|nr:IS110 family transposase [Winogradskyella sp.]MBT8245929.1 IS110 family transposase [Winogradskyella sp.]NNK21795.1 IS110 family transposase [Winogradskyella sp.]
MKKDTVAFEQVVSRGCGMDVHKEIVVVTIQGKGIKTMTKSFHTYTSSLIKLRDWLKKHKVTHIAMESTGVYWKPIYNVMGDDFEILLVNARHVKNVPGHKTDKKDSRWLCKLLLSGLLKGSYIPERKIRELRDLTRYRKKLVQMISSEKNRFQKILEDANIKLSVVLSDTFCKTGLKMLNVIVNQENYQAKELLSMVHGRVKANRKDIEEALTGYVTNHHRSMLKMIWDNMIRIEDTLLEVEIAIEQATASLGVELDLLQQIPGVGKNGAIGIIAEIGVDMSQFPDQKHLASWAGMCPGSNQSAGKNKSGRITYGNKYLRSTLVELGWAASRTKNTYFESKFKSMVGRRGKKKTIIALGHKILIACYHIIKDKVDYKELGANHLNNFRRDKLLAYYKKQLTNLGEEIIQVA